MRFGLLFGVSLSTGACAFHPGPHHSPHHHNHGHLNRPLARDTCSKTVIQSGDSCGSLAEKCQVTGDQFIEFNPASNLCSSLLPGQSVCCSTGSLSDLSPTPQADGTCATHTVAQDETCSSISSTSGITLDDLQSWNSQTWQFFGCNSLQIGQVICISKGNPPMPASLTGAVCGPQVPGTVKPADMSSLALLNPCPLNACCNIWGQCGTTADFCTARAPSSPTANDNVCIQNCGMDIVKSSPPLQSFAIGYFEGFNKARQCLFMDAVDIDADKYTHIHFAFANISEDYQVSLAGSTAAQWNLFTQLNGPKRILSFGGWSFSTSVDSYAIFGKTVSDVNRQTFVDSLVQFANNEGLDGFDFDWEYPEALDIPGIPPGDPGDGDRYLAFLRDVRAALPSHMSISIAAPASYWYLKAFPIAEISKVVDYIVYMTYDLHGQWDHGNEFSQSGCTTGDCLRSHVNLTETTAALSMITKAGVPPDKIVVGIASYGRAFGMKEVGCTSATCRYQGPNSTAYAGVCTQSQGILANAEIKQILMTDPLAETYYDTDSNSDILVYRFLQWVSYMSDTTKASRIAFYRSLGFLGTVDWAIDLQEYDSTGGDDSIEPISPLPSCDKTDNYHTLDELGSDSDVPPSCMEKYLLAVLWRILQSSLDRYAELMAHKYKRQFKLFAKQAYQQAKKQQEIFWRDDPEVPTYVDCFYQLYDENSNLYNKSGPECPPNYPEWWSNRGSVNKWANEYRFPKNDDDFCQKIGRDYGLDCSWFNLTGLIRTTHCDSHRTWECPYYGNKYTPTLRAERNIEVADPSETITKALSTYNELSEWLEDAVLAADMHLFPAFEDEAVDAAVIAVFSVEAAVEAMQEVADFGEDIEEAQRKHLLMTFVTGFLLMVPALGQAAGSLLRIGALARLGALAGEAGNVALSVYEIVDNPQSAPMVIMSLLLGAIGGGRNDAVWSIAALKRREMGQQEYKGLGSKVTDNIAKLDRMRPYLC